MCGIYGQFRPAGADLALIEQMGHLLAHRGPDGMGTYARGPLAFGAGRLAIIDLAAGVMPIFNEDGRVAVVFNGEIYNYRELRDELQAAGHQFSTATDTEVIVHGYEAWGDSVVERLRGMFAFAVWDDQRERLLLARDRLGEKPLYYAPLGGGEVLFASEIKALLLHPRLARAVNPDALLCYLLLGYVAPPNTMFAGVYKLAPGERLVIDRESCAVSRYWTPVMQADGDTGGYEAAVQAVRAMVEHCVEMRMMSDVSIGVFLSGGVDSTAVAALVARRMDQPLKSFTVGFQMEPGTRGDDKFNVDLRYARLAADHLGTDHHEITVREEQLADVFTQLVYSMDEPVAQPSIIQTAYVAALARSEGVPVLLSGDASDELFAGYPSYRADRLLERYLWIPRLLRESMLTPLLERLPFEQGRTLAYKSRRSEPVLRYLQWQRMFEHDALPLADPVMAGRAYDVVAGILSPLLSAPRTRHFADRIAFTSLNTWIAEDSNMRVDKMTMAMSVEARAPFEDHHLVDLALRLPLAYKLRAGDFKRVLKDAVRDLVPDPILNRPKWGFIPPSSDWLRTRLRPLVETHLSPERLAVSGLFDPVRARQVVDDHLTKRRYGLWQVWPLLVFQLWYALYIDQSLTLDRPLTPADLRADVRR